MLFFFFILLLLPFFSLLPIKQARGVVSFDAPYCHGCLSQYFISDLVDNRILLTLQQLHRILIEGHLKCI